MRVVPYRLGFTAPDGSTTDLNTVPVPMGPLDATDPSPIKTQIFPPVNLRANTVVVTPTSGAIPPPQIVPAPAPAPANPLMGWLQGSMIGGIPNWVLLASVGALLLFRGGPRR